MAAPEALGAREFDTGDVLFREGDAGDSFFVIREGNVRLWKDIDGEVTTLADLAPGDFVGEVGVMRSSVHTANATATAPTKCLVLTPQALEDMVTGDGEIAVRVIRSLADRLAQSHDLLTMLGQRDTRTRVAMAIIRHAEGAGVERDGGVWINRRLGDIADEVAVARQELGEIAKEFLKQKLLRIKPDGVLVLDVSRLYEFVKSGNV